MDKYVANSKKDAARARRLAEWASTPALEEELVKIAEDLEKAGKE